MSEPILTNHVKTRLIERGISVHDVKQIAKKGQIIKSNPDCSIVKKGTSYIGKILIVVLIKQINKIIIKTAYYED